MSETQDILYNVTGQTLVFDAPEGRPSSVTSVDVFLASDDDDGTEEAATTGSPAVETNPNTTFDAASGPSSADPRKLNLTATTGITVGRSYLCTAANGEKEFAEIISFIANDSARARVPLFNDYAAADTFQSTRISVSIDSTWVADENNLSPYSTAPYYRVRWVYVVGGVTYVHFTGMDLVRYAGGEHGVSIADMEAMIPGFADALPDAHRDDQGRRLFDEAYRQVQIDLHQQSIPDHAIRDRDVLRELVQRKTAVLWTEAASYFTRAIEPVNVARTAYTSRFDQLIRVTNKTATATGTGGGARRVSALPLLGK